jgi:hypothetical protein
MHLEARQLQGQSTVGAVHLLCNFNKNPRPDDVQTGPMVFLILET